ncbi:MAG: glycoside hydrolase 5 family protein [Armatimonadota bacterium]
MTDNNEMNEGNIAKASSDVAVIHARMKSDDRSAIHLVIADSLYDSIQKRIPKIYKTVKLSKLDSVLMLEKIAGGDSLVWIGNGDAIPQDLWCGNFRPAESGLTAALADGCPLIIDSPDFKPSTLSSAYIKPVKDMLQHNIDEEIRADFLPIFTAHDRFGQVVGYPGVLMSHYAPSLVRSRFFGSDCYVFLFDNPLEALESSGWLSLLNTICDRYNSALQIKRVETDFASYQAGEMVRVRAQISNWRETSASMEVRFFIKGPNDSDFCMISKNRRCPDSRSETEAVCSIPAGKQAGLWTIRVEIAQDPALAEKLGERDTPIPIDRREIGIVVFNGAVKTPSIIHVDGPSISIDKERNFWAGTHYYPSSSWWEWVWRDFRPLIAQRDFRGIRRTGYRLARVWVDPILDEQTLRSVDAAIYLAAQEGIILIVCVFTQWVREIGFQRPNGEYVYWDFKHIMDGNVYSISLRNMELQREYAAILAHRWRDVGNVIYNLSNETYIMDPDETQMDSEVAKWDGILEEKGDLRNSLLFLRWGNEITSAMRKAGAKQYIYPGYMFTLSKGGDSYTGNRDADIPVWHCYAPGLDDVAVSYFDPICSNRPLLIEEFGSLGWNTVPAYEACAHVALAGGATAAVSYEWGVCWLAREMCFYNLPLREIPDMEPDPRWFQPYVGLHDTWPNTGAGIAITPSGFGYGSIYSGTPFPAEAAVALGRLALMGKGLGRTSHSEKVYLVVPTAKNDTMDNVFNALRALWEMKAVFGVWQEDCLKNLPKTARVVICPDGVVDSVSNQKLDALQKSGVQIYMNGDDSWKTSQDIPCLDITPHDEIKMQIRRTVEGTLYSMKSEKTAGLITMQTERSIKVGLSLNTYAMVHERESGVNLVEGSGDVTISGEMVCRISKGRVIMASADEHDLLTTKHIRMIATEPTTIHFNRNITSCSLLLEGMKEPAATFQVNNDKLDIDSQIVHYVIQLNF